jgi:hypothetical protein
MNAIVVSIRENKIKIKFVKDARFSSLKKMFRDEGWVI